MANTPLVTLQPEMVGRLPRLRDYFGTWAIEESHFDSSLAIFERIDLSAHIIANAGFQSRDGHAPNAAVKDYQIGRIDLIGTLMKSESSMEESTSTVRARRVLRSLADNPKIDGIIQVIDSPGGTVAGTQDYAAEVRRAASIKPVITFFEDLGASAAYWSGAPATKIIATQSSLIGSIGTLLVVTDFEKFADQKGIKVHVLKRGDLKGAGIPGTPVTEAQLQYLDGIVGSLDSIFKGEVSTARGITLAAINSLQARVMPAEEALRVGLIDQIGNFDEALSTLVTLIDQRKKSKTTVAVAATLPSTSGVNSVPSKVGVHSMNLDDPVTLETLEQLCPGASAEFCMSQLKAKATIGQAIKANAEVLAKQRDDAVAKAAKPPESEKPEKPVKLAGNPVGSVTTATKTEGNDDFDSLVRTYRHDNPTMSRQDAVVATVRKHPEAHKAYLLGHKKNQLRQIKTKIENRAEIAELMTAGRLFPPSGN